VDQDAGRDAEVEIRLVPAASRDRNAEFTAFMQAGYEPLRRLAYLLSGDAHRADELTQETFERVYRAWGRARDGNPHAYARKILANLRIDSWRRYRREILGDAPEAAVESAAARVADRDAIVRALLLLPLNQRRVVVLRHMFDLTEATISDELGMPLGTVKTNAARGLASLRAILRPGTQTTDGGTP
jgi:RNA polymerase sigma-70 factor (sigma-E family)